MRTLYSWLIRGAAPVAFAALLWRGIAHPVYRTGRRERFGFGTSVAAPGTRRFWLHAVSLGEMTAAAPVIRALSSRWPQARWVLTTATPAGRRRAQELFPDAEIRYLPYDTPGAVRRFLARITPVIAIIMETELWPNLYAQCRRQAVPVLIANARLTERSLARYRRFPKLFAELFQDNVVIAAQSVPDAERFCALGAPHAAVHVAGNVKFDLDVSALGVARVRSALRRPTWVAGSTHAGEEQVVLEAHRELLNAVPDALLVLVPRHRERFDAVARLLGDRQVRFVRRSSNTVPDTDCPVVLGDTLGELLAIYADADAAFVGGSLVPVGGHNLIEPAALGVPVITGPSIGNAPDIAQLLIECGAAVTVRDAAGLAAALREILLDSGVSAAMGAAGAALVSTNRGSVERIVELIEPVLAAARPAAMR